MSTQQEFDFEAKPSAAKEAAPEASAAMIERIKKLLRLAADKRGNPHEAERAMQLAFELAEKYRVDVDRLDLDERTEKVMHEEWAMGMRFDRLRRGVCSIIMSFFHVDVVLAKPRLVVIGKPTDVLIAHYVFDFLLRAGRDCLRAYEQAEKAAKRRVTGNKRAHFTTGFIYGVGQTLGKAKQSLQLDDARKALVLAENQERDRYARTLGEIKAVPALHEGRRNETAIIAGIRAGRATQIHQPLGASSGAATLLLQ